ncbi:putative Steroid 5-alpha reductase C-terminal domain-containing protein [Seiridium cardinale]|uniref:Steroid 5-alpha reductase C-terminal domain-containing protein n=1 Tax=Seiridium cardinale TaxID=138064 RepID=A0ABR2XNL7_9PEZI
MALLQHLLHVTNFLNPFLRTLIPSIGAAFAIQSAFAVPSIVAQSERFYDASGALTFLSVTALPLLFQRVLKEGKDSRFDEIKLSPSKFFGAWMTQATWVSLCLMPVIAVNLISPTVFAALSGLKITDFLGLALYLCGFAFEVTADRQKSKWMHERERSSVMTTF